VQVLLLVVLVLLLLLLLLLLPCPTITHSVNSLKKYVVAKEQQQQQQQKYNPKMVSPHLRSSALQRPATTPLPIIRVTTDLGYKASVVPSRKCFTADPYDPLIAVKKKISKVFFSAGLSVMSRLDRLLGKK
jgi:hypothetical protein